MSLKRFKIEVVSPTRTLVWDSKDTLSDAAASAKDCAQQHGSYSRIWIYDTKADISYSHEEWVKYVEGYE